MRNQGKGDERYLGLSRAGRGVPRPQPKKRKRIPPPPMKTPVSGKQKRKLLRSTAWRLSKLVDLPIRKVLSYPKPYELVLGIKVAQQGSARRLVNKILRLRAFAIEGRK